MMKLALLWNKMQEIERKVAHNSAVKMKGREMKTQKSGKTAAQPTPSIDLDPSV